MAEKNVLMTFKRYEKKYLLTRDKYEKFRGEVDQAHCRWMNLVLIP